MSYSASVNWQKLNEVLGPVDLVLNSDLEELRQKDDRERTELWNRLEANQRIFENDLLPGLPEDLKRELASKFILAKLLVASAAYSNCEESPMVNKFKAKELDLVRAFERYNAFDILSADEIVQRIARKEDIYELVIDFYQREYANLDKILDDPEIRIALKLAFKNRYRKRLDKVVEGVKAYVGKYGPVLVVTQVEKKVWDRIKESEESRKKVADELEKQLGELTSSFKPIGEIDEQGELLKKKLSDIGIALAAGKEPQDLISLGTQKDRILDRYLAMEKILASQVEAIKRKQKELENRETELANLRKEYQEQSQEEKRRLVESELSEVEALKNKLFSQSESLKTENIELEMRRQELDSRLREISGAIEGKPMRVIAKEDARLCELNFIARFDTKMNSFPVQIYSPVERRSYEIRSWKEGSRDKLSRGGPPEMPANDSSKYSVFEKKYGFFGDRIDKVTVEAVSLNHLREFEEYGFDNHQASLADFLGAITRHIKTAEMGKYFCVLGIASPTGWDDKVKKEIESTDFAHNYVSRYVSVCLVDSATGEVVHNPADDRISKFVHFFQPQFDNERVARIKDRIRKELSLKDHVLFDDVQKETGEKRELVNKAFYDLLAEGKYRIRPIKGVGLVFELVT